MTGKTIEEAVTELSFRQQKALTKVKKILPSFLPLLSLFLPYLTFFCLTAIGVEAFSYPGFLKQFIGINSRVIFYMTTFLYLFFLVLQYEYGKDKVSHALQQIFLHARLSLPGLLFVYLILRTLSERKYANYIFAQFHFHTEQLLVAIYLLSFVTLTGFLVNKTAVIKKSNLVKKLSTKKAFLLLAMIYVFVMYTIQNVPYVIDKTVKTTSFMITHLDATKDEKMRKHWGKLYSYVAFVRDHTEENAKILIPPQEYPWATVGNEHVIEYILYPRDVIRGEISSLTKLDQVDYVLIAKGEWWVADENAYGWPKEYITSEKIETILVFDFENEKLGNSFSSLSYDPADSLLHHAWGLIKLRK